MTGESKSEQENIVSQNIQHEFNGNNKKKIFRQFLA